MDTSSLRGERLVGMCSIWLSGFHRGRSVAGFACRRKVWSFVPVRWTLLGGFLVEKWRRKFQTGKNFHQSCVPTLFGFVPKNLK